MKEFYVLTRIDGLNSLTSLRVLHLYRCEALANISDVGELQLLEHFVAIFCALRALPTGIERLHRLRELNVYADERLTHVPELCRLTSLRLLTLTRSNAECVQGIDSLTNLLRLRVSIVTMCLFFVCCKGIANGGKYTAREQ